MAQSHPAPGQNSVEGSRMMSMSEVQAEIAATRVSLAKLRSVILTLSGAGEPRKRRMTSAVANGDELRQLDRLYTCHTGTALVAKNAQVYRGHLYRWECSPAEVTSCVIGALIRIRRNANVGIHNTTHFLAVNYFASIWPSGLEWPASIPRPNPKENA